MVLERNEMVVCGNQEELNTVAGILYEDGYRMFTNSYSLRTVAHFNGGHRGFRWCFDHDYPNCIATVTPEIVNDAKSGKPSVYDHADEPCRVTSFGDFMARVNGFDDIDDLI